MKIKQVSVKAWRDSKTAKFVNWTLKRSEVTPPLRTFQYRIFINSLGDVAFQCQYRIIQRHFYSVTHHFKCVTKLETLRTRGMA